MSNKLQYVTRFLAVGNHPSAGRSSTRTPFCIWVFKRLLSGSSGSRLRCRGGQARSRGRWHSRQGSVLRKRPGPTAAKWPSRAGLVASTRISTSQWLLDKSQWRGKHEVKPGSQTGRSVSSSEGYMARHRHGCNSSGKGKEGVSEFKKAPVWFWGAPVRLLTAFS